MTKFFSVITKTFQLMTEKTSTPVVSTANLFCAPQIR